MVASYGCQNGNSNAIAKINAFKDSLIKRTVEYISPNACKNPKGFLAMRR